MCIFFPVRYKKQLSFRAFVYTRRRRERKGGREETTEHKRREGEGGGRYIYEYVVDAIFLVESSKEEKE